MAFSAGLSERSDEMRFRAAQQSPRDEPTFPSLTSPLRGIGSQMQSHTPASSDARGSLHRRFTTNTVPTLPTLSPLSPIGQQRRQAAESSDYTTATYHKVQLLEKKKLEIEYLREQRRRFEAEMELLDLQAKNQEDEMVRLATDLNRYSISGHQSEPTTPPEYRENTYSAFPRPNRFSASLASPPGLINTRPSRSGSQIAPSAHMSSQSISHIPSKSVPGSRRNSDEEEDSYDFEDLKTTNHRSAAALNRNSMPASGYDYSSGRYNINELPDLSSVLGHINTATFLFGDEDDKTAKRSNKASAESKTYLHMNTTDDKDKFPILVRRDGDGSMQFSASSAALDLATTQSPGPEQSNGWPSFARHRHAQHSLPMNTLRQSEENEHSQREESIFETPPKPMVNNRRSMEVKFSPFGSETSKRSSLLISPPSGSTNGMPKLQSSFSTNDIPTVKNTSGVNGVAVNSNSVNSHAEQHLHKHNASLGRIPPGLMNQNQPNDQRSAFQPLQSALHASAAPFGPSLTTSQSPPAASTAAPTNNTMAQYNGAPYYGGAGNYGVPVVNPMAMAQQAGWNGAVQMYGNPYNQYGQAFQNYGAGRYTDSQSRVIQQRRQANSHDAHNRFQDFDLVGNRQEVLGLCKDQYGCRFLQKKIEERNPEHIQIIFEETKDAVVELMTDPFGNYLCQKLLEFANIEQRTVLIKNAAPQMVAIALNQHGTRALQKMIEFIETAEQISTIISALSFQVVPLIQDLNGNHVIQKCLNHLQPQDAQFIFTAVGNNCIAVGTHRHGCCVLQRCIDHASGDQKSELVRQITENSIDLVQDPFGNYVVQYILDLHQPLFTQPLCLKFVGKVVLLSKQKFSSNVVEKCIRVADPSTKRLLIQELLVPGELEKVLRDSFANYVIQTALDYADDDICTLLIDSIRPILPSIRQTPYGRRIQSKIQEREGRLGMGGLPNNSTNNGAARDSNELVTSPVTSPFRGQGQANVTSPTSNYAAMSNGYNSTIASPQPHRLSNAQLPAHLQNSVQQPFPAFGRGPQQPEGSNGYSNFF